MNTVARTRFACLVVNANADCVASPMSANDLDFLTGAGANSLISFMQKIFGGCVGSHHRRRYRDFIADRMGSSLPFDNSVGGLTRGADGWEAARRECERRIDHERFLGDSRFVEHVLVNARLEIEEHACRAPAGWGLPRLTEAGCEYVGVGTKRVVDKGRSDVRTSARSAGCYIGPRKFGLRNQKTAPYCA